MFDSPTFSWVIAGISGVLGFVFIIGKGRPILDLFSSSAEREANKKRTPQQEKSYQRALAIFLFVLCANEIVMALFARVVPWIPFLTVGVVVVAIVLVALYIRRRS